MQIRHLIVLDLHRCCVFWPWHLMRVWGVGLIEWKQITDLKHSPKERPLSPLCVRLNARMCNFAHYFFRANGCSSQLSLLWFILVLERKKTPETMEFAVSIRNAMYSILCFWLKAFFICVCLIISLVAFFFFLFNQLWSQWNLRIPCTVSVSLSIQNKIVT